ncbi:lipopolysaccharide biosynthesis protein [Peribacillus sp. NPDC097197]|uniref:lipopolysaccharide biosynthesis protein n=1 Tax=Peribacillus sp. NPDC097197 TaxID=3390615 RepID=UPI003D06ECAE
MRTILSMRNIVIGIFSQVIIILLGFISRKVFLDSLGIDYLGIDGLLTNVLSVIALIESGIGISIVYYLYKPLSENDKNKIISLIQLYKKAYRVLALIVLIMGLSLYPFMDNFIKDGESISNFTIIYFIFIAKNMVSFLNAYKLALINADQRGYVVAKTNLIFQIITTIVKIIVLVLTNNYILYLALELILFTIQNIVNGNIVNRRYSYIKTKKKYPIDIETKGNLITNVKAMFLHNIGGFLVFGTDNILISSMVSIATVGIYSNYLMITQQLAALVNPILGGIGASVGNLIATESKEKNYSIFKVSYLVNFWIYSLCVIFLYNLLEPFISWWLGSQYLFDNFIFILILINFYLNGMRTTISTFKTKAGLFVQDKYIPLLEGVINLFASIILGNYFGLAGIFMGTTISTILTIFWTQPIIVYKHLFKKPVISYFLIYNYYAIITVVTCGITVVICNILIEGNGILLLIYKGIICLLIPNIIYLILFYRNTEFQYTYNLLKSTLNRKLVDLSQYFGHTKVKS